MADERRLTIELDAETPAGLTGVDEVGGKAAALGNYAVFTGDYENLFAVPGELAAASAEQLQAVAAQVFRRNNMTVGILRAPQQEETP